MELPALKHSDSRLTARYRLHFVNVNFLPWNCGRVCILVSQTSKEDPSDWASPPAKMLNLNPRRQQQLLGFQWLHEYFNFRSQLMLKSKQTNFGCSDKKKWKKNEDLDSPEGIIPTTGHHSWFLDHYDCLISSWAATGVQLTGESKIQYTTVRNVPKQRGVWMPTLPRAAR